MKLQVPILKRAPLDGSKAVPITLIAQDAMKLWHFEVNTVYRGKHHILSTTETVTNSIVA